MSRRFLVMNYYTRYNRTKIAVMVNLEDGKLIITIYTEDPKTYIEKVRESLIDISALVLEEEDLKKTVEINYDLAVLVRFQEHLL